MITAREAAALACINIYSQQSSFDSLLKAGPDVIGLLQVGDTLCVVPEGSVDWAMWESNLAIEPMYYPEFGNMEAGFMSSALNIYAALRPLITGNVCFAGHSRGAALCNILMNLCADDGIAVTQGFLFECPNVGYARYADVCAFNQANGLVGIVISTTNGLDPVPRVPITPYEKSYPTIELNQAPGGIEDFNLIDWHIGCTIYAGVLKCFP